jgi:ABC-type Zn uptake system ZnuABC Zn-binding protein ZnuA
MDSLTAKYHPSRWKELNNKIRILVEIENSLRPKLEEARKTVEKQREEYETAIKILEAIKEQMRRIRLERETIVTNWQYTAKATGMRKRLP